MDVVLANPRGFCAGVVRAIEIVERALDIYNCPIYVVHEIVHNQRVVDDLKKRGVHFVESIDQIPEGALTIFSAHGVSKDVINRAESRRLKLIDASCPLVKRVHNEVNRCSKQAKEVVMIGHEGHPEVEGTLGQYDLQYGGQIYLVQDAEDVQKLEVKNPDDLTYVTQTTLSVDDTSKIVEALRAKFPKIEEPKKDYICFATQNRQNAVRDITQKVDVLIVVGANNSSNSRRLRELGEQMGVPSMLVSEASVMDTSWFKPGIRVGLTAGASAPDVLIDEVLEKLKSIENVNIDKVVTVEENVSFPLPVELKRDMASVDQ